MDKPTVKVKLRCPHCGKWITPITENKVEHTCPKCKGEWKTVRHGNAKKKGGEV